MFNKLIVIFLIFLSAFSIKAQEKTDREKSNLNGYVKVVREETAKIFIKDKKTVEKNRELESIETFDVAGKQISYSFGKSEDEKETNIYDEKGRIKEIIRKKQPYSYLIPKKVRKYDDNDKLIEEDGFDEDGTLLGKETYKYDLQGNLIEESSAAATAQKSLYYNNYITKYKYDRDDRRIERTTFKKEGSEWKPEDFRVGYYKQIYFYNADGRLIAENRIGADEKIYQTYITNFDEKGREIESNIFDAAGNIKERTKYGYDEFDQQANSLKETEYTWTTEDGKSFFKPTEITYRQIEYFGEKEIKDFEAVNKPDKSGVSRILQNTDKEEYAVYQTILENLITSKDLDHIVIERFTKTDNFTDEKPLTIDKFLYLPNQKSLLEQSVIDDFNEKNYRRNSQLLENLFEEKSRITLINDSEESDFFSDGQNGWKTFYGKYPKTQGITTISRVGFNKDKTIALVYSGTQSDWLAGAGFLTVLQKQSDKWKILSKQMLWIS